VYTNSFKRNGRLCRSTGQFSCLFALILLALILATPAHAEPTLEHVDGLPSWADNDVALSGDGKWFAWAYENNVIPWLTMVNLDTGALTTVDLELTTGFTGLNFSNEVSPDINHDGSRIALIADRTPSGGSYDDLALVVNAAGAEIARLTGPDEYGDNAWFDKPVFIDASGRYVTFTSNATRLQPVIGGVTKSWSPYLEGWESAFRLDLQTGDIKLVAIKPGGAELQDYTYALGISDGGRFILFKSSATNLPGANGDMHVYLRDMNSTTASAITLVSVDETGTPVFGLSCCSTVPDISDDGSRVIYTEDSEPFSGGQDPTYLWTRDTGSAALTGSAIKLTAVTRQEDISISGDGRWLSARAEAFSRLNIDDGSTDPLPDDGSGSPAGFDGPLISSNGEIIIFWNNDIAKPEGEDGRWWLLRYSAGPPPDTTAPQWPGAASLTLLQGPNNVQISWPQASDDTAVTSYIVYRDGLEVAQISAPALSYTDNYDASATYTYTVEAADAAGNESIDGPSAEITVEYLLVIVIDVSEIIHVNDDVNTVLGIIININETITVSDATLALPSVDISVMEVITVNDNNLVLPSVNIILTEVITVSDDVAVNVGPTLADTINLTLPDGPLVPGSVITADAGGFKPFTPVQAFLQSEPVLVGEEMADSDGNVSFEITIPADFPPGAHTLILLGQNPDGSERRLTAAITIDTQDTIMKDGFE